MLVGVPHVVIVGTVIKVGRNTERVGVTGGGRPSRASSCLTEAKHTYMLTFIWSDTYFLFAPFFLSRYS